MRHSIVLGVLALALGCTGPVDGPPVAGPHDDHPGADPSAGHVHGSATDHGNAGGHSATPLEVETDPAPPGAGTPTHLVLRIRDEAGAVITRFDVLHEKLVHLIMVREGLDEFAHVHPEVDASGAITIAHTFPKSGRYELFVDHQPQGAAAALAVGELVVAGEDPPAATLVPNASQPITVGGITAGLTITPTAGETRIRFRIVDAAGRAVGDLQPYLGAMGHLVIVSADGREYVHAHPLGEATTASDGTIEFAAHFRKSGLYKGWGQFQRKGTVFTVPFVMEHGGNGGGSRSGEPGAED